MPREKILLTVTTYPLPSKSYDELVCTAGMREDGTWVRIYPMPLSFLTGMKKTGKVKSRKYIAKEKVRKKYESDFLANKDIYFFMGTTKEWHMRRAKNPFVIIGVFYPKKAAQTSLFG